MSEHPTEPATPLSVPRAGAAGDSRALRSRVAGGGLVLGATPIGDPLDASLRLVRALEGVQVIAAEDTRRVKKLAAMLDISLAGRVIAHHEHNEASSTPELIDRMAAGESVLLVTDAGMPSVSDPGYRLVAACAAADIPVTCLPGPSAVLVALALSGLPTDRFCFEGFMPRKAGERARRLAGLATEPRTMVFFEAPHRLETCLQAMAEAFGPERPAAVCRELTKTYEEVRRGTLAELVEWAQGEVRGEISIVVAGATRTAVDPKEALALVLHRVDAGERLKDACKAVAADTGTTAKGLYDAAVAARRADASTR